MKTNIKNDVYDQILHQLVLIKRWSESPVTNFENFDIDKTYAELHRKYGNRMEYPFVSEIYNLTDVLCDSIRHNNNKINSSYTVSEALSDLDKIINVLEKRDFQKLENDMILKSQLNANNLYK